MILGWEMNEKLYVAGKLYSRNLYGTDFPSINEFSTRIVFQTGFQKNNGVSTFLLYCCCYFCLLNYVSNKGYKNLRLFFF